MGTEFASLFNFVVLRSMIIKFGSVILNDKRFQNGKIDDVTL